MASEKEYKKLPGKKRNFLGFSTLWLGPDHLLLIDTSGYTERYKRFYYKDIQAITACRINSWKIVNIVLAFLCALLFGLSFYSGEFGSAFSRFMGSFLFLCFIGYLLWGPSLKCYLKTAIQTEKLPTLYQYRKFKKALALIKAKIENAQGTISMSSSSIGTEPSEQTPTSLNPYKAPYN